MRDYEEDYYEDEEERVQPQEAWQAPNRIQEVGCGYCYDNRTKKDIEIFFFDRANNMRLCEYCPSCGRKL